VKKLEIYLKLKKTIENFLEVRKNSIQEMKLKESNGLNIQYYLYLVNCLIYEQLEKIPKNFKDELKEEILNWTRYRASYGKYDPLEDYNLLSVSYCWDDKEKNRADTALELVKKHLGNEGYAYNLMDKVNDNIYMVVVLDNNTREVIGYYYSDIEKNIVVKEE